MYLGWDEVDSKEFEALRDQSVPVRSKRADRARDRALKATGDADFKLAVEDWLKDVGFRHAPREILLAARSAPAVAAFEEAQENERFMRELIQEVEEQNVQHDAQMRAVLAQRDGSPRRVRVRDIFDAPTVGFSYLNQPRSTYEDNAGLRLQTPRNRVRLRTLN